MSLKVSLIGSFLCLAGSVPAAYVVHHFSERWNTAATAAKQAVTYQDPKEDF